MWRALAGVGLLSLGLAACGVSRRVHRRTAGELQRCQHQLETARKSRDLASMELAQRRQASTAETVRLAADQRSAAERRLVRGQGPLRDDEAARIEHHRQFARRFEKIDALLTDQPVGRGVYGGEAVFAVPVSALLYPNTNKLSKGGNAVLETLAKALAELGPSQLNVIAVGDESPASLERRAELVAGALRTQQAIVTVGTTRRPEETRIEIQAQLKAP